MSQGSSGPAREAEQTVYKGIHWRRVRGRVGWFDEERATWVFWRPGQDAPPRPPGWDRPSQALSRSRPGWRSPYRIAPVVLVVAALVIALVQVLRPSGNAVKAEAAATAKLPGQCLSQHGNEGGHPRYSATPVSCADPTASVKVVAVLPTAPGNTQTCPAGTAGYQIPYNGVQYPHILCLQPLHPSAG